MARNCSCHADRNYLVAQGFEFHEANRLVGKRGYHEHRCECGCGCNRDTIGYAKCVSCSFDKGCAYACRTIEPSARAKRLTLKRANETKG